MEEASHKLSEAMYKAAADSAQAGGAPGEAQPGAAGEAKPGAKGKDDNAVDADFEEVK